MCYRSGNEEKLMALLTPLNVNCHASDGRKVKYHHLNLPSPHILLMLYTIVADAWLVHKICVTNGNKSMEKLCQPNYQNKVTVVWGLKTPSHPSLHNMKRICHWIGFKQGKLDSIYCIDLKGYLGFWQGSHLSASPESYALMDTIFMSLHPVWRKLDVVLWADAN